MNKFKVWKSFIQAYLIGLAIWGVWAFLKLFDTFIMGRGSSSETLGYISSIPIVNFFCAIPIFIIMFVIYLIRRRSPVQVSQFIRDKQFNAMMDEKFPGLVGLDHAKSARDMRNEMIEGRREYAKRMNEVRIREGLEPWDPKKTAQWINLEISAFDEQTSECSEMTEKQSQFFEASTQPKKMDEIKELKYRWERWIGEQCLLQSQIDEKQATLGELISDLNKIQKELDRNQRTLETKKESRHHGWADEVILLQDTIERNQAVREKLINDLGKIKTELERHQGGMETIQAEITKLEMEIYPPTEEEEN